MRWLRQKYKQGNSLPRNAGTAPPLLRARNLAVRSQRSQVHRRVSRAGHPLPLPRQQHTGPVGTPAGPGSQLTPAAKAHGAPGAVRIARRVRRGGRGDPPGAILAGRPGPTQLPAKRQVIPRSRGTDPEPPCPRGLHGTDGVGPALLSPGSAPVRWLLMDGYVYDICDDQDHPPWQEGRSLRRYYSLLRSFKALHRLRAARPTPSLSSPSCYGPDTPPTSTAGRARRSAARGRIAGQADYAKPAYSCWL